MTAPRDLSGWLPTLIGPLELQQNGVPLAVKRSALNFVNATITDSPENERTDIALTAPPPLPPANFFQYATAPFTTPPAAASWPLLAASVGASAPTDFQGGGVLINAPVGGNIAVATKALAVPGGGHVITMFIASRIMPTDKIDVRSYLGLVAQGASHFAEARVQFSGDSLGVYAVGSSRQNVDYFTGSANLGFPWSLYKGGYPFAPSWWRMTVDDGSYGLERFQIGGGGDIGGGFANAGTWELVFSAAHGCGPIQRVGLSVRSNLVTPVSAILLSYAET